jgi:catechol 2,3-dioxygenase-like lactoylglutathione lyase family enzyme
MVMELVQGRIVTEHVERMALFYARVVGASVAPNEYYVEVPTGSMSVGFSRPRFTEDHVVTAHSTGGPGSSCSAALGARPGETIFDFVADDVDAEYGRLDALGVDWVLLPTVQPWGKRSMIFRDPEGHLVSVFSRETVDR